MVGLSFNWREGGASSEAGGGQEKTPQSCWDPRALGPCPDLQLFLRSIFCFSPNGELAVTLLFSFSAYLTKEVPVFPFMHVNFTPQMADA